MKYKILHKKTNLTFLVPIKSNIRQHQPQGPKTSHIKNMEESVPEPVQDTVAERPGTQSATDPTNAISAETEEEESQIVQPEQILTLQRLFQKKNPRNLLKLLRN